MILNDRQKKTLRRLAREKARAADDDDGSAIDLALAHQLERKGLVMRHHVFERMEWNKVVARLRVVTLTPEGDRVAALLLAEIASS